MIGQLLLVRGGERDAGRRFSTPALKWRARTELNKGEEGMRIGQGRSLTRSSLHRVAHSDRHVERAAA